MSINDDKSKQKQSIDVIFIYQEGADILKMSESGAAEQNPAAKSGYE